MEQWYDISFPIIKTQKIQSRQTVSHFVHTRNLRNQCKRAGYKQNCLRESLCEGRNVEIIGKKIIKTG